MSRRKFSDREAAEIREAFADGLTRAECARLWNTFWTVIDNIVKGRTYKERPEGVE